MAKARQAVLAAPISTTLQPDQRSPSLTAANNSGVCGRPSPAMIAAGGWPSSRACSKSVRPKAAAICRAREGVSSLP
jgi:hypothetical protein